MRNKLFGVPTEYYPKKWRLILSGFVILIILGAVWSSFQQARPTVKNEESKPLESFHVDELIRDLKLSEKSYLPFLNKESLRCGIYSLAVGATDRQQPHDLDEVYYVLSGKAKFTVEGETVDIKKGSVLFVEAFAKHAFHDIEEDLDLLVFFSTVKKH